VLADALGSVIVIASAAVVWLTEWEYKYYIDPALSLLMVALILRSVWPLLQESALILLQTVPTHIQVSQNLKVKMYTTLTSI
jgi:zinc transporter 1